MKTTMADLVFFYSDLDSKFSQLKLHQLSTKNLVRCGKKKVIGDDDEIHTAPLFTPVDIVCAFDIETSTVYGCNIVNGKKSYYSAMYCCQFAINNRCIIFRTWNEFKMFIYKLPRLLHLSPCTVLYTWVHNFDYENSYIKHRFDIDITTYFGKNKQHPIKYLMQNHFYMHDSYSITQCSLAKLAEMYKTEHKKAVGDIDHSIARNHKTPLSDREIGYVTNDVFVLTDFGRIMFDEFLLKRGFIPDTATQILSKELQENAIEYADNFIPGRMKKIRLQYDETDYMYRRSVLKSIHGKIFGFEWTENNTIRYAAGMVESYMFTPFDENEKPIGVEGREIYGKMHYDFYEWLFRGGYTKSNARYTSTERIRIDGICENVYGFDYKSSYPFCQTICNFPMSRFIPLKISDEKLCSMDFSYGSDVFENKRYIIIATFYEIESIDDFSLESSSKVHIEGRRIIDNGRIQYADKFTACLTDCDFALYKMYYKWGKMDLIKVWVADAKPLPDYLLHTIWKNGEIKESIGKLKKTSPEMFEKYNVDYVLAKGKFNSGYGLCCKQPIYTEFKLGNEVTASGYRTTERVDYKYFGKRDIINHELYYNDEQYTMNHDKFDATGFDDAVKSSILSPFWGIWVSAFARYNLLSCMKKISNGSEWITNDVVYCDTDSMYFRNIDKHKHVIDEWNEFAAKRVAERLPTEYPSLRALGRFDNIAIDESGGEHDHFTRFKTLGAKRYIKTLGGKTKVTIAGLPHGALESYCKKHDLDIYHEFNDGMDFKISDVPEMVKIARTYHDELVKINIAGEIMTEYSSCTLYPSTFKLSMLDIYKAFINAILESSGGKAYARGVIENEKEQ